MNILNYLQKYIFSNNIICSRIYYYFITKLSLYYLRCYTELCVIPGKGSVRSDKSSEMSLKPVSSSTGVIASYGNSALPRRNRLRLQLMASAWAAFSHYENTNWPRNSL